MAFLSALKKLVILAMLLSVFPVHSQTTIGTADDPFMRAIFMSGNWGCVDCMQQLPQEYFDWLNSLSVNWVGISVALHVEDSVDSTVERKYQGVSIPTFEDVFLQEMIRKFKDNGFKVYLTLAFEDADSRMAAKPLSRWQIGDPNMHLEDLNVQPENWPWRVNHPDHSAFVAEFWSTYTDAAVHFAELAAAVDVDMYSLGTETERLFRSRSGGQWQNHFNAEMNTMVAAVRAAYSGLLTYDMHEDALIFDTYAPGSEHLWGDIGLDVIGISAYYTLIEPAPSAVPSVADLEQVWAAAFEQTLLPLKQRFPDKPIVFTEFGYTDSLQSPSQPAAQEFEEFVFMDLDGNGLDDGEETQANIYRALFNQMAANVGVLSGAFLWGNSMMTDAEWDSSFGLLRDFSIRDKLSETVVQDTYSAWLQSSDVNTATIDLASGELLFPVVDVAGTSYRIYMTLVPNTDPIRLEVDLERVSVVEQPEPSNHAFFDGTDLGVPKLRLAVEGGYDYYSLVLTYLPETGSQFQLSSATPLQ